MIGACEPYATPGDMPEGCPCVNDGVGGSGPTEEELEELLGAASDLVWSVLGQQPFGECETTIYPCRRGTNDWALLADPRGQLTPRAYAHCCGEGVLLEPPVIDVTEVVVAGDVLDPSAYLLRDGMWLERRGGSWPAGSRTDLDAFHIAYVHGYPVPMLVRDATIEIANELWLERCGNGSGKIPKAVSSASARGTSYDYGKQRDRVEKAGTALPAMWKAITAYNPTGQPLGPLVYSPDEAYSSHRYRVFT